MPTSAFLYLYRLLSLFLLSSPRGHKRISKRIFIIYFPRRYILALNVIQSFFFFFKCCICELGRQRPATDLMGFHLHLPLLHSEPKEVWQMLIAAHC